MRKEKIKFFEDIIFKTTGINQSLSSYKSLSGGCINNAVHLRTTDSFDYCLKYNQNASHNMFQKEAQSLEVLLAAKEITIPNVIGVGVIDHIDFILLEYIDSKPPNQQYWTIFGEQLARLHRHSHQYYGLSFDNFIGSLHQKNTSCSEWSEFFLEYRLRPQFELAYSSGLISNDYLLKLDKLRGILKDFFPVVSPSLIHGDLWSGNVMTDNSGGPCIIDPATYYGHREIEIAFTKLFGGFSPEFYDSYHQNFPLEKGFEKRVPVYNLYPLMVHVNLFGTSYLSGVNHTLSMLEKQH